MGASLAACVLAALLATGSCLQCEVCDSEGTNCTGALQTCPAGHDSCAVGLSIATLAGLKTQTVLKRCVPSSLCEAGIISLNCGEGMMMRTSITCCVGAACRTTTVTMPLADPEPNGRSCPACYTLDAKPCAEVPINCTGAETQCLDVAGNISLGRTPVQMVMKGCVTESICNQLQVGPGTVAGISANLTTAKCTVANGAAGAAPGPAGLLLPALAGLLLLRLLS